MRSKFDQQLAALNQELTEMGATCARAISLAAQALEEQNVTKAAPVAELEEQTNEQERSIEALCLKLLLQQQPVARDLRQISAALKMITDMERIGDQAADIAEIIPFFLSHNTFDCRLVCRMAQQASGMHFSDDIVNVPGTSVMGEQRHAEYQVDQDALLELILSIFYEPVEG